MKDDIFYKECADLLDTTYDCESFPWRKRTRWNNRKPGSGRYPGYGLIRCFGDVVHVVLHTPVKLNATFTNKVDALNAIKQAIKQKGDGNG